MNDSAEKILEMATNVRDCAWPADVKPYMELIEPMLRAYAADLRAREAGVTDEVVTAALKVFVGGNQYTSEHQHRRMRAALIASGLGGVSYRDEQEKQA